MPDECWALEYARGNIVSMLPFGVFDTIFSQTPNPSPHIQTDSLWLVHQECLRSSLCGEGVSSGLRVQGESPRIFVSMLPFGVFDTIFSRTPSPPPHHPGDNPGTNG